MYSSLADLEKNSLSRRSSEGFIPGYTGHCPTLEFYYGQTYGSRTKEILKDMKNKRFRQSAQPRGHRKEVYEKTLLKPLEISNARKKNNIDFRRKAPRFITGYTGFIPTFNFRYGQSFCRTSDDCMDEFSNDQFRLNQQKAKTMESSRALSAPHMIPIRSEQEMKHNLHDYFDKKIFKCTEISPDYPPIAGYTGHIPNVKGNENSLSQRYNTAVKMGLTLLKNESNIKKTKAKAQHKINLALPHVEIEKDD